MNVTLTNLGSLAVPYSSSQDKGFAALLEPSVPVTLSSEDVTVLNVGDNPSALEELTEGVQHIIEQLGKLLTFWRDHAETVEHDGQATRPVSVKIENHGTNALRVLLGINTEEVQVGAGEAVVAEAPGYVEIRELGV